MSAIALRIWTRSGRLYRPCTARTNDECAISLGSRRKYVTHNQMDFGQRSKLLADSLDARQRPEPKHDNVGPFQLGLSPSALRKEKAPPKWSELSTSGKVMRTTARTTNFGVIVLGAGLSALLVYSLTSELFSKNSPTVLYGDACERIKSSNKILKYLNAPLTFHNNPPSSVRPRHRNRHVPSRVMVDAYGQEHMIMTFFVQGRREGEAPPSETSYLESLQDWTKDKATVISDLSYDEAVQWSKESGQRLWEKSINLFKYLAGKPVPPPSFPALPAESQEQAKQKGSTGWGFTGMFSSLKGGTGSSSSSETPQRSTSRAYTEGEVHADFIKDKDGYFQFRYLLVDIPGTQDRNSIRVFVERTPGVRENEPVMRWSS